MGQTNFNILNVSSPLRTNHNPSGPATPWVSWKALHYFYCSSYENMQRLLTHSVGSLFIIQNL